MQLFKREHSLFNISDKNKLKCYKRIDFNKAVYILHAVNLSIDTNTTVSAGLRCSGFYYLAVNNKNHDFTWSHRCKVIKNYGCLPTLKTERRSIDKQICFDIKASFQFKLGEVGFRHLDLINSTVLSTYGKIKKLAYAKV